MRTTFFVASALALLCAATTASAAVRAPGPPHLKGAELSGQAKVPLATARAIALKARPGKITDEELEREGGGSGLRYAFDIASGGKTFEVGVDAKTGRVLENGPETAAKEAAEARAEHKPTAPAKRP